MMQLRERGVGGVRQNHECRPTAAYPSPIFAPSMIMQLFSLQRAPILQRAPMAHLWTDA